MKSVWILMVFMGTVYGMEDSYKHSLKCNMLHLYDEVPAEVDNLADMFSQGVFYGCLRFNSFGLKESELKERGIDDRLIVVDVKHASLSSTTCFKGKT